MADNILSARIMHLHDIEANWSKYPEFVPKRGEVIVYDKDETHNYQRTKIGDGETSIINLPFSVEVALEDFLAFSNDVGYIDAGKITDYPNPPLISDLD